MKNILEGFNSKIGIQRLKQSIAEKFDPKKKIPDENFEKYKEYIQQQIQLVKDTFKVVTNLIQQQRDYMLQTEEMGECLYAIYQQDVYYADIGLQFKQDMTANKQVIGKNEEF